MIDINLKYSHIKSIGDADIARFRPALEKADSYIKNKNGKGSDYVGWIDLPVSYDKSEFEAVKKTAARIRQNSDVLLVVGIGGSYLGARAAIEFLGTTYHNIIRSGNPEIYFIGNSFSGDELKTVLSLCEGKRISVNVISKSGTTTECAIAFRFVRDFMRERYSAEELKKRIIATTDSDKGVLRELAVEEGYECFTVPDDIGGRFSVLTSVGLLPLAVSGANIELLMKGAADMRNQLFKQGIENDAYKYAVLRNIFLEQGKFVEMFVSYDPDLRSLGEWFKQLFGESEGKEKKGIFPSSVIFTTDLHSLGQYVQDGSRILFETILRQSEPGDSPVVPFDNEDPDGLNYLAGTSLYDINKKAFQGTLFAHADGGADSIIINFPSKDEYTLGSLIYFFFTACAASGYILGINPFDQPGVEAYKKNMFALLGKTGHEEKRKILEEKIKALE